MRISDWSSDVCSSDLAIFSWIALGRPAGATSACHMGAAEFLKPNSPMVGTLGSEGMRCGLLVASARSLPDFRNGGYAGTPSRPVWISLDSKPRMTSAPVLYGTY